MELIGKSALVAEIEKRRKKNARNKLNLAAAFEDNYLLSFINTIEVKEVDLEKELGKYLDSNDIEFSHQIKLLDFAKHFFELGFKTQKGE